MDTEFDAIATNPTLVARGTVPWQAVASVTPPPAVAGFTLAPSAGSYTTAQMAALSAPPAPQLSAVPPAPLPADADEDAAESHRAPDESFAVIHAEAPQLASAAVAPKPVPAAAAPKAPVAVAAAQPKPAKPQLVAAAVPPAKPQPVKPQPAPKPQQVASLAPRPALRPEVGEPATDSITSPGRNWTIQIGAYGNQTLAKAQLTNFVSKAKDILGAAAPFVAPIQYANGHTLYRARFGPYAEREARNVCSQLAQRGQTCFAVVTR
jgi:D-alanyl-D-alanine carboxypeptidase